MVRGRGWEEVLAPHQCRDWEVLGLLLLWCWDQGGQAEGKAFRPKKAGALPAEKLGFSPTSPKIFVVGSPFSKQEGNKQRWHTEKAALFIGTSTKQQFENKAEHCGSTTSIL